MDWLSYDDIKPEVICYGNNRWVCSKHVIGINTDMIWYSDGESYHPSAWTPCYQSTTLTTNFIPNRSCYGDAGFVICGIGDNQDGNSYIFYSPNGIDWSGTTIIYGITNGIESVCYGNGRYICVDSTDNNRGALTRIFVSFDMVNWTNTFSKPLGSTVSRFEDCSTGDGKFIVVGNDCIYISYDGYSWYYINDSITSNPLVSYGNAKFIITSTNNKINYSTDAYNWDIDINSGNTTNNGIISFKFTIDRFVSNMWKNISDLYIKHSINGLDYILNTTSPINPNLTEIDESISASSIYSGGTYYTNIIYDLPKLTTDVVTGILHTGATCGGNITSEGTSPIISRGVCWNRSERPTIWNSCTINSSGTGSFTSTITGLNYCTTYCVRAYATNSTGTQYGNEENFTTLGPPFVTTSAVTYIDLTGATCLNYVYSCGPVITSRGICWSTLSGVTIDDNFTIDGSGSGLYNSYITGLTPNTLYYINAYAINDISISYGIETSFTTLLFPPTVTIDQITNINETGATCGGFVTFDGGASVTERGVCWSILENPTILDNYTIDSGGTGSFISSITGLTSNVYYIRAYATNSSGTSYSEQLSFATSDILFVTTNSITNITETGSTTGGNMLTDGGYPVLSRGVCWSSVSNPTILNDHTVDGSGIGLFTSILTGLTLKTTYYVKSYATNTGQTYYGNEQIFTTTGFIIVETISITNLTKTGATCGGIISGYGTIISKGICWSKTQNPTLSDDYNDEGGGFDSFTSDISGLRFNTTYYVRSYALDDFYNIYYGDNVIFTTVNSIYSIGSYSQGGQIFYIEDSGEHGLVTSYDLGCLNWGCQGILVGASGITNGTGQFNTTSIINGCSARITAGCICNNLIVGGYNDWYLPSKDEICLLYQERNHMYYLNSEIYWSSTEINSSSAWAQNFIIPESGYGTCGYGNNLYKNQFYGVRAIRNF